MNFRQPAGISTGQEVFSRTRGVEPKERRIYEAGFTFSRTRGVEPKERRIYEAGFTFSRTRGVEPFMPNNLYGNPLPHLLLRNHLPL